LHDAEKQSLTMLFTATFTVVGLLATRGA